MRDLDELIFIKLGEASMCWEPIPTGVFDSSNAKRIGDELVQKLKERDRKIWDAARETIQCSAEDWDTMQRILTYYDLNHYEKQLLEPKP